MELTGGGSSTVNADGVTIQGTGSVASPIAIKAVQHDATLTGNGTVASPLAAAVQTPAGWPITWFNQDSSGSVNNAGFSIPNRLHLCGFSTPSSVQYSKIYLIVTGPDAANLYSVGIYTGAGVLVSASTPATIPLSGNIAFAQASGPFTIAPGRYYLGLTCTVNTAVYAQGATPSSSLRFFDGGNTIVTASGVLPGSITPPADVLQQFHPVFALST